MNKDDVEKLFLNKLVAVELKTTKGILFYRGIIINVNGGSLTLKLLNGDRKLLVELDQVKFIRELEV